MVSAGPGVGKSRLARAALAEADGALVEWVQATRSAATVLLAAVATLVPPEARSDDVVQLMRGCAESLRERAAGRSVVIAVDDARGPLALTLRAACGRRGRSGRHPISRRCRSGDDDD